VKKCVSECMSGEGTREWQQATRAGEKHLYSLTRSLAHPCCLCECVHEWCCVLCPQSTSHCCTTYSWTQSEEYNMQCSQFVVCGECGE
jgi:hypothetical protein